MHQRSGEDVISSTDRVWELMKKIGICMLASWDGQELQARPMGAYVRPDDHAVLFLADARHHKDDDIRKYPKKSVSPSLILVSRIMCRLLGMRRFWTPQHDPRAMGDSGEGVVELAG